MADPLNTPYSELVRRLRSRAWDDRQHRELRAKAADAIEELISARSEIEEPAAAKSCDEKQQTLVTERRLGLAVEALRKLGESKAMNAWGHMTVSEALRNIGAPPSAFVSSSEQSNAAPQDRPSEMVQKAGGQSGDLHSPGPAVAAPVSAALEIHSSTHGEGHTTGVGGHEERVTVITPSDKPNGSWTDRMMAHINKLTPNINKAFSPDWFLLRQCLEEKERDLAVFAMASSSKTDWCPCCKQGWGVAKALASAQSATLEWQAWDESEGHDHGLVWWTDGESVSIGSLSAHGDVWHILGVHGPKCSDMKPTHYLPLNPPRYVLKP